MTINDDALLALHGVTVRFGGLVALREVTLTVQPGRVVGVIGPNGAGKTTLFNVMCGLARPESGRILWQGKELRRHSRSDAAATPAPILGAPVSRRTLIRRTGAFAGALGTLALLEELAIVPQRVAWADGAADAAALPDVQFNLAPFMPPAQTIDGIPVALPPVNTTFLTARLARIPTNGDQVRLEAALRAIETAYPFSPSGVFVSVAYSDNYFDRLPNRVVVAAMPKKLAFNGFPPARRSSSVPFPARPMWRTETVRSSCAARSSTSRCGWRTTWRSGRSSTRTPRCGWDSPTSRWTPAPRRRT